MKQSRDYIAKLEQVNCSFSALDRLVRPRKYKPILFKSFLFLILLLKYSRFEMGEARECSAGENKPIHYERGEDILSDVELGGKDANCGALARLAASKAHLSRYLRDFNARSPQVYHGLHV